MNSKINKELHTLVREEVISKEVADKISNYYTLQPSEKPNRLFMIFGIFGALLVGSGILLIIAHNWDNFSKITKTFLAFVPLLLGQLSVGFSILKNKNMVWKETSGTILFFGVGASISLISQINNILGDLHDFLFLWISLCLPLVYLLKSKAVALLSIVLSTYYAISVGFWGYGNVHKPWYYIIFITAILPHYWILLKNNVSNNSTVIFNWVIPISITIAAASFVNNNTSHIFLVYLTLFGLLYNVGRLDLFKELKKSQNGYLKIGSLGTIIFLLIATFRLLWIEIFSVDVLYSNDSFISSLLLCLGVSLVMYTIVKKGIKEINLFQVAFIFFWIVTVYFSHSITISLVLINILVFALGLSTIRIGANKFDFVLLNYGLLIISVLIIFRFFDTEISFIIRGLLFIAVGVGFFLTNYIMLKRQQQLKKH